MKQSPDDQKDADREHRCAPPFVLSHPACSGGSMIYKLLASQFGFLGVYEVGHLWARASNLFQPFDPEVQLLHQGIISEADFGQSVVDRLLNCWRIAGAQSKRLLIREHTHQFFFDNDGPTSSSDHSWIVKELSHRLSDRICLLATVRDPVDCWLGMRRSFPTLVAYDFHAYCGRFNFWLDKIDEAKAAGWPVTVFKYEDIVTQRERSLEEIGRFLGAEPAGASVPLTSVVTSGNSGRSSSSIGLRARRAYSRRFADAAKASDEYRRLVNRLGYLELRPPTSGQAVRTALQDLAGRGFKNTVLFARGIARPLTRFASSLTVSD
jgi:hypothetical protein